MQIYNIPKRFSLQVRITRAREGTGLVTISMEIVESICCNSREGNF